MNWGEKDKIQDSWGGKEQDLVEMRKWEWVESCPRGVETEVEILGEDQGRDEVEGQCHPCLSFDGCQRRY